MLIDNDESYHIIIGKPLQIKKTLSRLEMFEFKLENGQMVGRPYPYAVHKVFPFEIVDCITFESGTAHNFEYNFFNNHSKAIREMCVKSYEYYKEIGDEIMTETYIDVIEKLQEEEPEIWV